MSRRCISCNIIIWSIFSLVFILSSCGSDGEPVAPADNSQATSSGAGSSSSTTVFESAVRSPVATPIPGATALPQPAAGKGSVTGSLVWVMPNGDQVKGSLALLYLGPVVYNEQGVSSSVSLDKELDPMTMTDEFGRFAFVDIEPGTYGLIYGLAVGASQDFLLNKRGNTGDFLITVEAGKITSVGQITTDYPLAAPAK